MRKLTKINDNHAVAEVGIKFTVEVCILKTDCMGWCTHNWHWAVFLDSHMVIVKRLLRSWYRSWLLQIILGFILSDFIAQLGGISQCSPCQILGRYRKVEKGDNA